LLPDLQEEHRDDIIRQASLRQASFRHDLRQAPLTRQARTESIMSKKIERTLASLLLALVASGGSSKIH
jgi:hypothetical protein